MNTRKTIIGALALAAAAPVALGYELTILHINDHHSHLDTSKLDLKLDGKRTRTAAGGFPALVSAMRTLSDGKNNVLKIHAGDALSGSLYYTLFKGEADAAMMNAVCFDAFALGNHEFDAGDAGLASFLDHLKSGNCKTAVLAANVKPEVGTPLAPNAESDYILPSVIVTRGGERIGIVGIDIVRKTVESSNPDPQTRFLDEKETAQAEIDALTAAGVNKIVLVTHYQYENDLRLAAAVTGVDVIVGGDSHTLLGRDLEALGLRVAGDYPTVTTNKSGETVCVVQGWEYAKLVGELNVTFDDAGTVTACAGTPHLLLANTFKRKNAQGKRVELEGDARAAVLAAVKASPALRIVRGDGETEEALDVFREKVDELKNQPIGAAKTTLCLERIPGQGKSKNCDAGATASHGSDISNIVAKAFLMMSKTSHIGLQNGGGVRVDLLEGPITIGDAYTLMPFANTLVELEMTGDELVATLEDALDYAIAEDGLTGAYPYASGLRWKVDRSKPKGSRFFDLEVNPRIAGAWNPLDRTARYKVVTNSYIAGGKDGYKTLGVVSKARRAVDLQLEYAQSFVDYVMREKTLDKLPTDEYSTQAFFNAKGMKQ